MRELTFTGFLTRYVRSLSKSNTNNIFKLADEAAENNPRLREPLLLYAFFSGKKDVFIRAAKKHGLTQFYGDLLMHYDCSDLECKLQKKNELPQGYTKVWQSYMSKKNEPDADNHTKELMRQKVRNLQAQHRVSNYRLYTDLRLNPGNLNAWLKYGESEKVSLNTARQALKYMSSFDSHPQHK